MDPDWPQVEVQLGATAARGHDQVSNAAVASGRHATRRGCALLALVDGEPLTRVSVAPRRHMCEATDPNPVHDNELVVQFGGVQHVQGLPVWC